jgi:hypothetical protein
MNERRGEPRLLCADLVEVEWSAAGRRHRCVANLEDISAAGLCLQVESPVPLDAEVSIRMNEDLFAGSVRYCVHREIGYYLGISFAEGTRWTPRAYRPQHLLDPQKLVRRPTRADKARTA